MELQVQETMQSRERHLANARNARWRASPQGRAWTEAHEGTSERRAQKAKAASIFRAAHPDRVRATQQSWRQANPLKNALIRARARAKVKQVDFRITEKDFPHPLPTHSPISGVELKYGGGQGRIPADNAASIDRRNSALGYIPGNVFIISFRENTLKRDGTAAELRAIADWMDNKGGDNGD